MDINIPTTEEYIFEQYLHILNPVLGKNKLSGMEIALMSKFLYIHYTYKNKLDKQALDKLVFHKEVKNRIITSLKEEKNIFLTTNTFNVLKFKLRKKGFISNKEILHKVPIINNQIQLNYVLFYKK